MNLQPVKAEIDLNAFRHNCQLFRNMIDSNCRLCVAVKTNCYGHGVDLLLPVLKEQNVDALAVVTINEAVRLRDLGWDKTILLMGTEVNIYQNSEKRDICRWLVENRISITVSDKDTLDALAQSTSKSNQKAIVHIMLDSGMTREGVYESQTLDLIQLAHDNPSIDLEGVYTHLAVADDADKSFTIMQLQRFSEFVNRISQHDIDIPLIHAANSPATIDLPKSHFTMVRPGVSVYGYHSSEDMHNRPDLRPILKLTSRLSLIKSVTKGSYIGYGRTYQAQTDMITGLVPIGYGDGYDRRLSNKGIMTIDGHHLNVIGRVSMDQTILDLTPLAKQNIQLHTGQEVTVINNKPGTPNDVPALCRMLDTIPQEITSRLGNRVSRIAVEK